jgi:NAD(P)-dependent dehydrogenase (short-subunit alcohol dehydrogenase family)
VDHEDQHIFAVLDPKAALPHLKPGSVIIATATIEAYDTHPDLYDYGQTRAVTMNFVKSLAKQLTFKGVRWRRRMATGQP